MTIRSLSLYFLLIITFSFKAECISKLNVPTVLLPLFKDITVNFTLDVTGTGCFKWSTSRPDLISITPIYETEGSVCSKHATVKVLTKELARKTAVIYVEDSTLAQALQANVIIDVIASLQIVTKCRQLYVEEPPQMFEVRAYDNQGNEFTTLGGVEFQWTVHATHGDPSEPAMRLMTFSESPYETPNSIAAFDAVGKHGHIALLEGIKTGTSKVDVQLPYSEYSSVPVADVQIIVVAKLVIEPQIVYMLPGDVISLNLYQIRYGKKIAVNLSDQQYSLISQNPNIATVSPTRKVLSHSLGKVEIFVQDSLLTSIKDISAQFPSSTVVVTDPQYLTLTILPFNSWSLITNQHATIIPELYSSNNQKFALGENVLIRTQGPKNIFRVKSSAINGTITGTSTKIGSGSVYAELMEPLMKRPKPLIFVENTLYVFPPLIIVPQTLILPWSQHTYSLTGHSLKASGGDGNFMWSSALPSIAEVSQSGHLKFNGPGTTEISVSMKKNKYAKATATIHLLNPEHIEILNDVHEVEVGNEIYIHIILYGKIQEDKKMKRVLFSSCDFLDFVISPSYPFVLSENTSVKPIKPACAVRALKSIDKGFNRIKVQLESQGRTLSAYTTFSSFHSLNTIQPSLRNSILIAPDAAYDLVFSGGPTAVFGPVKSKFTVPSSNSLVLVKTKVDRPELYVFNIKCLNLGSIDFELTVKTIPFGYNFVTTTKRVTILCKEPKNFEVIGTFKTGCSEISTHRMVAYPASLTRFDVKFYDEKGNEFHNATTALLSWKFENENIASFTTKNGVFLDYKTMPEYLAPTSHYVTASTFNTSGDVIARGYLYDTHSPKEVMSVRLLLSVVQDAIVEPNSLSLFNHPEHTGFLKISGGSGFFEFDLDPFIAHIKYSKSTRTAEVVPQSEGMGTLVISDKCLPGLFPQKVDIHVLSVGSVLLSGPLKIQEGYFGHFKIQILDKQEKEVTLPNMSLSKLGIKLVVSDSSIADYDLISKTNIDSYKGLIEVTLKGKKLGNVATWIELGEVSSNVLNLQVYPRLKVIPSNLTLVSGSEIQLTVKGGPSMDAYYHFIATDPHITSASKEAVIKGLRPGHTTVTVRSVGYQGEIYSKDVVEVHVINLAGIQIVAPINQLGIGNTMPMWARGVPHNLTPLLLGSIYPPLQFKWDTSVSNIVQIQDTLHKSNIQVSTESKLSIRLLGLSPGHTNVELQVYGRTNDRQHFVFNSSFSVYVFQPLEFIRPILKVQPMLMAPGSSYPLKLNMALEKKSYNLVNSSGSSVITLSPEGILRAGSKSGTATVEANAFSPDGIAHNVNLIVQVKPVRYLMINIGTSLDIFEDVNTLPHGLNLNLTVSYHDEFGNIFYVAPFSKPLYDCNICSKIHVSYSENNHSLITSLTSSGNIVMRVYDTFRQVEMEDYVKVPVENHILPKKTHFTVGDVVCFWTPILSPYGTWSTDSSIIHISKKGVAYAEKTGFASIIYSASEPEPVILSSLSIEVLPLISYYIGAYKKTLTNAVGSKYIFPIFLINDKSKKEAYFSKHCADTSSIIKQFPFKCELHFTSPEKLIPIEKMFSVKEEYDVEEGSYICSITPLKGATQETSVINQNLTLTVTNQNNIYEALLLNFHPQFLLSVKELYCGKDSDCYFYVSGSDIVLSTLYIEASKHESIALQFTITQNDSKLMVKIKLEGTYLEGDGDIYISISSPLTDQDVKIPIRFKEEREAIISPPMKFIYHLSSLLVIFIQEILKGLFFDDAANAVLVYMALSTGAICIVYNHMIDEDRMRLQILGKELAVSRKTFQNQVNESLQERLSRYSPSRPLVASPYFLKKTSSSFKNFKSPGISLSPQHLNTSKSSTGSPSSSPRNISNLMEEALPAHLR